MPHRRSSIQRSPPKRDQTMGMLRRSSAGAPGMVGPAGADLLRSSSARFEHASPAKVVVPVRLVRSNTSANHSTSRRHLILAPPRKAHPNESRYSNQSWRERQQEAEVEDLSSVTTPVEPITNRTSLVGALAQSARSSSNKSVLALVQVASATVAAITTSAPASISENKEEEAPSPPSPVVRSQRHQLPPSLPSSWRRALQSLLVAADALCIAANSVRLWARLLAPTTPGFQAVLPAPVFAATSAERVMGGALWEVGFAIFHSISILRLFLSGSVLLRRSNRVVPLNTGTSNSTPIQRIKISSQSSASVSVALQDRANAAARGTGGRGIVKAPSRDWLWNALSLRVELVAYPGDDDDGVTTEPWTRGSTVLLLTNWVLQLCIAAGMSAALPTSPSTPHEFYVTVIMLSMWVVPTLYYIIHRFRSRRARLEIDQFFHLVWITSSLAITIIGIAVVPLAVFHHQCRGSYRASMHRFDSTKRLEPVWIGHASLAMEWLVTTSAGAAALRVITGMCVMVTMKSIHAAIVEDAAQAQRTRALSQQSRRQSNPSARRKTSLTSAIPETASVRAASSGSKWLAGCKAMQNAAASPLRLACPLALTLGIIAIAGHSSSPSSGSLPDSCVLQLRPWFDSRPACAMLDLDCPKDATITLDDLLPSALPASSTFQLKFLSIRHCARLEMTSLIAQMPSLVALTLTNATVASWASPLSYPSHPNLRAVTLADATIAAPFLDAQIPPIRLGELLACGQDSAYPPVADAQRLLMPLLEETRITSCD